MKTNADVRIKRCFDATRMNRVLNHEAVRPWVANTGDGVLDLTGDVSDHRNILLMGEHGGTFYKPIQEGVYEVHTAVLPEGRGEWTRKMTAESLRLMFTCSNAYEVVTRVPRGHVAALAAAKRVGMRREFTAANAVMFRDKVTDLHVLGIRVQDWASIADGLVERGEWLHTRMAEEAARLGIETPPHENDDESHNRYAGAAVEMAFGGQLPKAVSLYCRWVSLVRHTRNGVLQHIQIVSLDPPVIRFDLGLMRFHRDDIEVIRE